MLSWTWESAKIWKWFPTRKWKPSPLSFSLSFQIIATSSKTMHLQLVVSCCLRHLPELRHLGRELLVFSQSQRYFIQTSFLATVQTVQASSQTLVGCTHLTRDTRRFNPQFSLWTCRSGPDSPFFHGTLPFSLQTAPAKPPSHCQLRHERLHEWVRVSGDHLLGRALFSVILLIESKQDLMDSSALFF